MDLDDTDQRPVSYTHLSTAPTIGLCIRSYADEEEERLELWRQFVENKKKLGLLFDRLENTEGFMSAQEIPLKLDGRISSYLQAYEQEDEELGRFVRLQASCKGCLLYTSQSRSGPSGLEKDRRQEICFDGFIYAG